jgi:hypothetical protein
MVYFTSFLDFKKKLFKFNQLFHLLKFHRIEPISLLIPNTIKRLRIRNKMMKRNRKKEILIAFSKFLKLILQLD